MPKYLVQGQYSPHGLAGLKRDKASGRKAAVAAAMKKLGGKVESFHFTLDGTAVTLIVDLPSAQAVAAICVATAVSGAVKLQVTPLLTIAEMDEVLGLEPKYWAPGEGR